MNQENREEVDELNGLLMEGPSSKGSNEAVDSEKRYSSFLLGTKANLLLKHYPVEHLFDIYL